MRILHTSDWHVGKVLKGQSRLAEHIAVLAQVVEVARAERPDLVIVAGDLYDTAAPSPDIARRWRRANLTSRWSPGLRTTCTHGRAPRATAPPWRRRASRWIRR